MNALSGPAQESQPQPKSIARRFACIGLPIVILAAAVLFLAYRQVAVSNLRAAYEDSAKAVTATFATVLWPDIADFVSFAHSMPVDMIRGHAITEFIQTEVAAMARGSQVLKVKFHDLNGFTVF